VTHFSGSNPPLFPICFHIQHLIQPFVSFFPLQYIRKLLFSDLDKTTIEHVLRQLRKFPWSECEPYLLKCFMKVHKGKYGQIHLIASLTAGLSRYHDEFAVAVVDEVC
jgi:regulator of nonsense transcripts 2